LARGGRLEQYGTPAAVLARPATAFVADFVGSGRTLRRLDLLSVTDALLSPGPHTASGSPSDGPAVGPAATLGDAMAALLSGHESGVPVVDGGALVGFVTLESIRAALRQDSTGTSADSGGPVSAQGPPEVQDKAVAYDDLEGSAGAGSPEN
ncbi:MAG TPA: CBS domain-containing protein, partial [Acidimicrobiia bacterium]|nr:CBS domain-containing protein [Acidimicrobiia bacterium]